MIFELSYINGIFFIAYFFTTVSPLEKLPVSNQTITFAIDINGTRLCVPSRWIRLHTLPGRGRRQQTQRRTVQLPPAHTSMNRSVCGRFIFQKNTILWLGTTELQKSLYGKEWRIRL